MMAVSRPHPERGERENMTLIKQEDAIEAVCKLQKYDLDERNRLRIYAPWHGAKRIFVETEAIYKTIYTLPSAEADGEDLIIKGAKGIQDGLYNIKDGKLFEYKAKGGTVRTYPIVPSAEAEPMTEEVREALMRLSMCAREDCVICKYKDKCNFDFRYEESTKNMNTILDSLMRSKCEVDAKWIPCSERLPRDLLRVNVTWINHNPPVYYQHIKDIPQTDTAVRYNGNWYWWDSTVIDVLAEYGEESGVEQIDKDIEVVAWMPLPKPYREDGEA